MLPPRSSTMLATLLILAHGARAATLDVAGDGQTAHVTTGARPPVPRADAASWPLFTFDITLALDGDAHQLPLQSIVVHAGDDPHALARGFSDARVAAGLAPRAREVSALLAPAIARRVALINAAAPINRGTVLFALAVPAPSCKRVITPHHPWCPAKQLRAPAPERGRQGAESLFLQ